MARQTYLLGDLPLSLVAPQRAPFEELFGLLTRADDGTPDALELEVKTCARLPTPPPREPRFFHGETRVGETSAGWALEAPDALVLVDDRGVHARVLEPALAQGHPFPRTTLFIALTLALRARGLFHLHAGLARAPRGEGLLVVGASGRGKSTTTLALAEAGARVASDDAVFVPAAAPSLVRPFPKFFHLSDASLEALPRWQGGVLRRIESGKLEVDPRRAHHPLLKEPVSVRHLLFPRLASRTALSPLSGAEALGSLIESSAVAISDDPARVGAHLEALGRLVEVTRASALELGPEWLRAPADQARALLAHLEEAP